ncbi:VOC family protein [Falsiroseomonas selenitidurans]|uniref:Glyoxalase n=1 Tax=Falsiroseomonas selenitidurans TaxID=2716335 RepID=A0ABX1E3S0_9PROT|nr:VOC family protein [Falsiroseomonas selenitidurans]NKC31829.1 glyoxalase [Falsiroseomonas selenitidurans]
MEGPAPGTLCPCLRYQDAPAAIDWLERAFGFRRGLVVPDGAGGIAHAELHLDGAGLVMLGSVRPDDFGQSPGQLGNVTGSLYVRTADADAAHARAVGAGAVVVRPLENTDYGSRAFSVRDPEGHVWSFGTYWPAPAGDTM